MTVTYVQENDTCLRLRNLSGALAGGHQKRYMPTSAQPLWRSCLDCQHNLSGALAGGPVMGARRSFASKYIAWIANTTMSPMTGSGGGCSVRTSAGCPCACRGVPVRQWRVPGFGLLPECVTPPECAFVANCSRRCHAPRRVWWSWHAVCEHIFCEWRG